MHASRPNCGHSIKTEFYINNHWMHCSLYCVCQTCVAMLVCLMLNGRVIGDIQGAYTSYQYNGAQVIDYCLVSYALFKDIVYFKVLQPSHLSDHTPVSVCKDGQVYKCPELNTGNSHRKITNGFKWENSGVIKIQRCNIQFGFYKQV